MDRDDDARPIPVPLPVERRERNTRVQRWTQALHTSAGVHRPSSFSVALAALLPDLTGLRVADVGSGAGLISIAALDRGAAHVVALDRDPHALADTKGNVGRVLGERARARMSMWEADWSCLALLACDVLLVNPPQRPTRLLSAVPEHERHLHVGGGADGLDGIRAVLTHARAGQVLTTASSLLDPGPATLACGGYGPPDLVASAEVVHHTSWRALTADLCQPVHIWRYPRRVRGV